MVWGRFWKIQGGLFNRFGFYIGLSSNDQKTKKIKLRSYFNKMCRGQQFPLDRTNGFLALLIARRPFPQG